MGQLCQWKWEHRPWSCVEQTRSSKTWWKKGVPHPPRKWTCSSVLSVTTWTLLFESEFTYWCMSLLSPIHANLMSVTMRSGGSSVKCIPRASTPKHLTIIFHTRYVKYPPKKSSGRSHRQKAEPLCCIRNLKVWSFCQRYWTVPQTSEFISCATQLASHLPLHMGSGFLQPMIRISRIWLK